MVGERGVLGSEGSPISLVAVVGLCRCSSLVSMATNVARERILIESVVKGKGLLEARVRF